MINQLLIVICTMSFSHDDTLVISIGFAGNLKLLCKLKCHIARPESYITWNYISLCLCCLAVVMVHPLICNSPFSLCRPLYTSCFPHRLAYSSLFPCHSNILYIAGENISLPYFKTNAISFIIEEFR